MIKSKKHIARFFVIIISLAMILSFGGGKVYAEPTDANTTLKAAFDAFNACGLVFLEYSITGEGELLVAEKVKLDRENNLKNVLSQDPDTNEWTTLYTDMKEKITYYKDGDKWYKYPTDEEELQGLGKTLSENGVETDLVQGATYAYDGEETIAVANAHTDEITEVDCYRYLATIPVIIKDDNDYDEGEEEEEDDEEDADEEDPDEEPAEPDLVNIYYFIAKDSGKWVHAETRDGLIIDIDITYPDANDPTVVEEIKKSLQIPKEAVENAVLEEGFVTPVSNNEVVSYKVVYKGKKAYLVVTKAKSAKKVVIKKSVKILGTNYPVLEIGASAFANNKKVQTVVINANLTKIDKKAFYNTPKLKSITIKSKKLKTIGKNAFDTNSKKLTVKLSGNKKYKAKIKKLITKSRAKKAAKKTKLTVK